MSEKSRLGQYAVFSEFTEDELAHVEQLCRFKKYGAQEQIIDRQSDSRDVYFILSGRVRIVIYSLSGREITLDDVGPGGYFGELAALDSEPRSASVMALEPTEVASLTQENFLRLLEHHPKMARNVMLRLTTIVRQATERIMDLSTLGANNRVHAEVLRQARAAGIDEDGQAVIKPIPVHSDIASRVSTTRETVARVMNDLARRDIVKRDKNSLVVLDAYMLEEMVDEVRGDF